MIQSSSPTYPKLSSNQSPLAGKKTRNDLNPSPYKSLLMSTPIRPSASCVIVRISGTAIGLLAGVASVGGEEAIAFLQATSPRNEASTPRRSDSLGAPPIGKSD